MFHLFLIGIWIMEKGQILNLIFQYLIKISCVQIYKKIILILPGCSYVE